MGFSYDCFGPRVDAIDPIFDALKKDPVQTTDLLLAIATHGKQVNNQLYLALSESRVGPNGRICEREYVPFADVSNAIKEANDCLPHLARLVLLVDCCEAGPQIVKAATGAGVACGRR